MSNQEIETDFLLVHSQAEYIEQDSNSKQKRFRRAASLFLKSYFVLNKMLFFGIVFVLYFFELSEKSGLGSGEFTLC